MTVSVRAKKTSSSAIVPAYQTNGAAGMDLHAAIDKPIVIGVGQRLSVPTGLIFEILSGYEGQIRPRSGLALKHGVTVLNAPGTIDSDYRGEVRVVLVNHGPEAHEIRPGDRIAQIVFAPVTRADVVVTDEVSTSDHSSFAIAKRPRTKVNTPTRANEMWRAVGAASDRASAATK